MTLSRLTTFLATFDPKPKTRGTQWEHVCKWFLKNDPQYGEFLTDVWLWDEWPGRWGPDGGIDLVAEAKDGTLWAIQAKCYRADRNVTRNDMATFIAESEGREFTQRLLIATSYGVAEAVDDWIVNATPPASLCLRHDLDTRDYWPESYGAWSSDVFPKPSPKIADPHQATAVHDTLEGLRHHDRVQTLMACGTGKSLVALWVHEKMGSTRTLVLVPSIQLVKQTIKEWIENRQSSFAVLPVCSDDTVRDTNPDPALSRSVELGYPAEVDPVKIRRFLQDTEPRVVFSTYQSLRAVVEALAGTELAFDLVIADEAHHCAGDVNRLFSTVLHQDQIRARKRVFMTATPRISTVRGRKSEVPDEIVAMDDVKHFGPVVHTLPFGQAISDGLLSEYQLVVLGIQEEEVLRCVQSGTPVELKSAVKTDAREGKIQSNARTLAGQIGLAKAMRKYDMRRGITFHGLHKNASRFAALFPTICEWMPTDERPSGRVWATAVYGSPKMSSGQRQPHLDQLKAVGTEERGLLCNVRCLGEGVDIPTVDGIAFIDPMESQLAIVQAVGRAIRKPRGASEAGISTIVIPVMVGTDEDPDNVVTRSAFREVHRVLLALQAHDDVLKTELSACRRQMDPGNRRRRGLPRRIVIDMPEEVGAEFSTAITTRILRSATIPLPLTVEQILAWADAHHARTEEWPTMHSGVVDDAPGENWGAINTALRRGNRGLPGGSSLPLLLVQNGRHRHLTVEQILAWADAHHARTEEWPTSTSGVVDDAPGETWRAIDSALRRGSRGLPGGSSLSQLLVEQGRINRNLTVEQILAWADAHHKRKKKWPTVNTGDVYDAPGETWVAINSALRDGYRGLPGGSSLSQLLVEQGRIKAKVDLTVEQILAWADAHHARTEEWPTMHSGVVDDAPGENWGAINGALRDGYRGLPGGSSLLQLLVEHGRSRNFTVKQILAWADAHHARTEEWPTSTSGVVDDAPGETWRAIDSALRDGYRGLPGGSSLSQLLVEYGRSRNLTVEQILAWADAHHKRKKKWPTVNTGDVYDAPGETWVAINSALRDGYRGLPGGSSLSQLLVEQGRIKAKVDLTVEQILAWADAHHARTEEWPTMHSGVVDDAPGETWAGISQALRRGLRGLPKGSSLSKLLVEHGRTEAWFWRKKDDLTVKQILTWADAHHELTGKWPTTTSGVVDDAPGETWAAIDGALREGGRGLPKGSSLFKLLVEHGRKEAKPDDFTVEQILDLADAHHKRTGKWPTAASGVVHDTKGEHWAAIDSALRNGYRGLPKGSSVSKLLVAHGRK